MPKWPLPGGSVPDPASDQNFNALATKGGEVEDQVNSIEEEGLPPTGKVGGVLKGELPNPEFAKEPAYKADLDNEKTAREEADKTEKESRQTADTAEAGTRKSEDEKEVKLRGEADTAIKGEAAAEKAKRKEDDEAETQAREEADEDFVVGPAAAVDSDIAVFDGTTGKLVKDSGKTIAQVLLEAEEVARALVNAAAAGLSVKQPVTYATTGPLTVSKATATTLEGKTALTVDGVKAFSEGTRILVKDQVDATQNGVYEVTLDEAFAGTGKFGGEGKFGEGEKWLLTRTSDADTEEEVKLGMFILVTGGSENKASSWILTSGDPVIIGTTAQVFAAFTTKPTGAAGGDLTGTYPNPTLGFGVVDSTNIEDGSIALADLAAAVTEALVPAGSIMATARSTAPTGYLLCDGSAVSRTGATKSLFEAIGTVYGEGDKATTFNLPDLRGRFPVGLGTNADVDVLGESDGLAVGSRSPKHVHGSGSLQAASHTHAKGTLATSAAGGAVARTVGGSPNSASAGHTHPITGSTAAAEPAVSGESGSAGPGFLVINHMIKT